MEDKETQKPRMTARERDALIRKVWAKVGKGVKANFACEQVGLSYDTWIYHTTRKGKSPKKKREEPPQHSSPSIDTTEAA